MIGVVIVVGTIFLTGWLAGGSFGTGQSAKQQRVQIEACLPIADAADLSACLTSAP
ncbi:hypothetical protein [Rhodococcus sp. 27YEA15]|uniref:hypothetical protein n=1 Tax=Rhodococcus sp. 27YEA15 TaxID=3156259 RepID=UPI003C7C4A3A